MSTSPDPRPEADESGSTFGSRTVEFGCVGVIVAILLGFMSPVWWPLLTTPAGRDIPSSGPTEANRVFHPDGFSIVIPPNWTSNIHRLAFYSYPQSGIPRRYSATLAVVKWGEERPFKNLEGLSTTTFQRLPAHEMIRARRGGGFLESPAYYFSYEVIFRRRGDWYVIRYGVFEELNELPDVVREYLNTFRVEEGRELPAAEQADTVA